jgi:hypothetical protein
MRLCWSSGFLLFFLSGWIMGGMWFYYYGAHYSHPAKFYDLQNAGRPIACGNQKQCRAGLVNLRNSIR